MRFIRITRGAPGVYNANGLEVLRCALWVNGREVAHVPVISGVAGRQNFRTLANERRGLFEPIPEGRYTKIGDPEWHGKVGDHTSKWSEALGAVVIEIYGERAIMLHIDGNVPGSAGCVCPMTLRDLDTILSWWAAGRPDWVECDWGFGTVPKPTAIVDGKPTKVDVLHWTKLFVNDGRLSAIRDEVEQAALMMRLDYHDGKLGVAINGVQLPPDRLNSLQLILSTK